MSTSQEIVREEFGHQTQALLRLFGLEPIHDRPSVYDHKVPRPHRDEARVRSHYFSTSLDGCVVALYGEHATGDCQTHGLERYRTDR